MRSFAFALAVCFPLLASGVPESPPGEKPVKIAAPGFTAVNVDDKVATFFSDHFAQQLALGGLSVISASEIQTLLGFERSKALMGCSESAQSCIAELGGALGVDGVVTGSIGKFGGTFQANIKVLGAGNAQALSIVSRSASSDEQMLYALTDAAHQAAADVLRKLGRHGAPADRVAAPPSASPAPAAPVVQPAGQPQAIAQPQPAALRYHQTISFELGGAGFFGNGESLAGPWLALRFEPIFSTRFTLPITVSISGSSENTPVVALGSLGAGLRWYVSGDAPWGLWASAGADLYLGSAWDVEQYGISPGLSVGYSLGLGNLALSLALRAHVYWPTGATVMFVPGLAGSVGFAL